MTWAEILASGTIITVNFLIGYWIGRRVIYKMERENDPDNLDVPTFIRKPGGVMERITRRHRKGGPVKVSSPGKLAQEKEDKVKEEISNIL